MFYLASILFGIFGYSIAVFVLPLVLSFIPYATACFAFVALIMVLFYSYPLVSNSIALSMGNGLLSWIFGITIGFLLFFLLSILVFSNAIYCAGEDIPSTTAAQQMSVSPQQSVVHKMQVIAASAAIGAGVCSIFKGSPRFGLAISALAAGTGFMWYNAAELIAKAQSSKITTAAAAHTELEIKKAGQGTGYLDWLFNKFCNFTYTGDNVELQFQILMVLFIGQIVCFFMGLSHIFQTQEGTISPRLVNYPTLQRVYKFLIIVSKTYLIGYYLILTWVLLICIASLIVILYFTTGA